MAETGPVLPPRGTIRNSGTSEEEVILTIRLITSFTKVCGPSMFVEVFKSLDILNVKYQMENINTGFEPEILLILKLKTFF